MQTYLAVLATLVLGAAPLGCKRSSGREVAAKKKKKNKEEASPYDVKPLLRLLRPRERRTLPAKLGLKSLGELPFYDIDLVVDPVGARLAGRYRLSYRNDTGKPLTRLPLLLHPNAPRELGAKGATASIVIRSVECIKGRAGPAVSVRTLRPTLAELHFRPSVAPGHWVEVEVVYTGRLRRLPRNANDVFGQALSSLGMSGVGAGASDYGLLAVGDGVATLASAYPMIAPFRAGRFDTDKPTAFGDLAYNQLANFRLRTALPPPWRLVTNLVELPKQERLKSGQRITTSVGAATRDLVIVAVRDLQKKSLRLGDITVTSVYRARDRAGGQRTLRAAHGALALFQRRYGRYPYTELDVTEASLVGGAGGVEFPGMVLIAGMFYRKPSNSSNPLALLSRLIGGLGGALRGIGGSAAGAGRAGGGGNALKNMDTMIAQMADFVVAHEVAHQYFAGLVGADCRSYPAVDEPLAQFAAGEYMRSVHGDREGRRIFDMNAKANYGIYRMLGGKDLPAGWPVRRYPSALAYAAIVYGKAPYFYVALQEALGATRLDQALAAAVREKSFQLVTLEQWVSALARGAGSQSAVVRRLAKRHLHGRFGDRDLGVDGSGDQVLAMLLGKQGLTQIKQALGLFGMSPKSMFRTLLGKMAPGPVDMK